MTKTKKRQFCEDYAEQYECEIITADGFDEAIIGIVEVGDDHVPVVCYDMEKCISILCVDMPRDDAIEYFDFNVKGSHIGPRTPLFVTTPG